MSHFDLPAGKVEMDGATAAKFARYRYASNDFSRAARQQQLIWAIREKALETDIIPKIPELWKALSKTFKTDLHAAGRDPAGEVRNRPVSRTRFTA